MPRIPTSSENGENHMPSLEDFREKMTRDADEAMKEYVLLVDCFSLDYAPAVGGPPIQDEFKVVPVIFEFSAAGTKSFITMRGRKASDPAGRDISYLPWKNAASGAVAKATLDGSGPAYFSTSQLDGCRFTIQYHDASHKTVTVQHLAGDLGGSGTDGSAARDRKQAEGMPADANPTLRRRLSFGPGEGKLGRVAGNTGPPGPTPSTTTAGSPRSSDIGTAPEPGSSTRRTSTTGPTRARG